MSGHTGALDIRIIDGTFSPARAPPHLGWDCVLEWGAEPGYNPESGPIRPHLLNVPVSMPLLPGGVLFDMAIRSFLA